ncbi:MAG: HNH endonuclease signature motif containing protein [Cyclobacteriaceae bacterium]
MYKFREIDPLTTSNNDAYDNYSAYKPVLEVDFHHCCGYCNDHDFLMNGWRGMHIDHFAPVKPFIELRNTYENLVYACFYCNSAKSNDWATDSADSPCNEDETEGYMHPREIGYNDLFERTESGGIMPVHPIGFYMYTKLNLGLLRHSVMFTIRRITIVIEEIDLLIDDQAGRTSDVPVLIQLKSNKNELLDFKNRIERQFMKIVNAR